MLSPREIEYCKYFIEYKGDLQAMADKMFIAMRTIQTHRQNIYNKLCVNSKQELMHYLLTNMGWNNPNGLSKKNLFKITKNDNGKYDLYIENMQEFIKYILQFGGDNGK